MNWGQIISGTISCFVALLGIAIIFDVPPKKLPWAMLGSVISCVIMLIGDEIGLDPLITNMIATAVPCVYCDAMARVLKTPTTIFMIPTLLPLVPGSRLYYTMFYLFSGQQALFMENMLAAVKICTGIAMAIIVVTGAMRWLEAAKRQRLEREKGKG
ncbi:MAG: threonine/serine exporter family protein [Clostridia bacterium]|nr:threonine/serine exporter family protein [Clostridia bacterium]MBO7296950.1 threonine/serine exporter family protein [Clostridia bacterium]